MLKRCLALLLASLMVAAAYSSAITLELTSDECPCAGEEACECSVVAWQGRTYTARPVSPVASSRRRRRRRLFTEEEPCEAEGLLQPGDPEFLTCLLWVCALITIAGLMAGCTMGVLSLDPLILKLRQLEGSDSEKRWANAVLPVLESHHQLLVALLLCNAGANEALPIFLDKMVDEKTAVLISVSCVLIFGEILPSAIMTGPHQLQIAAALAPAIRLILAITSPISWPMAKLLDCWLGHTDGMTRFKRNEFKALIQLQARAKGWTGRSLAASAGLGEASTARPSPGAAASPTPRPLESSPRAARKPPPPRAQLVRQLSDLISSETRAVKRTASGMGVGVGAPPQVQTGGAAGGKGRRGSGSGGGGLFSAMAGSGAKAKKHSGGGGGGGGQPAAHSEANTTDTEFSDDEVTILHAVFSLQVRSAAARPPAAPPAPAPVLWRTAVWRAVACACASAGRAGVC